MSIRKSLLFTFSIIIAVLLISNFSFLAIEMSIKDEYKKTINNIVVEYTIINTTDRLVSTFNNLLQDIDNKEMLSAYTTKTKEMENTFSTLDKTIIFEDSKASYQRIKNDTGVLKEYFDRSIDNTHRHDFTQSAENLEQIDRSKNAIREDTTNLILTDLSYAKKQQQSIQTIERLVLVIGLLVVIVVSVGSIMLAFMFSNKLSAPLTDLALIANTISKGNLDTKVDKKLLQIQNEAGSLSRSFDLMLRQLVNKIHEVEQSNMKLQQAQTQIQAKTEDLEKMNKLMIGREVRMAELKKLLEQAKIATPA